MNLPNVMPLQELYLNAIVTMVNADKLEAVLQVIREDQGRLWLVREGSTVPHAQLSYNFDLDSVKFQIITRDERVHSATVKYAEGIDGFLESTSKFMKANLLAAPKKGARAYDAVARKLVTVPGSHDYSS